MIVIDALRPGGGWPDWSSILGIALGFCGAALLIGWNANAADSAYLHGALAVVAASFLWALGSIYAKTARLPRSPLMVTGMEMLVGGTAQIIPAWTSGEFAVFTLDSVSWRSALSWIYLTVVGPIAFAAYAWLLRNAPIPLVATYSYVNPVVAICLGYFLGRELISPRILIAAALVVGSVALVNRAR
jgi:drug/metabolite transporter (DMT)-like permease